MALTVEGVDVLSYPEFQALMETLDGGRDLPPELTAWWAGENVPAAELIPALDVGARMAVNDPDGHRLIDLALNRMRSLEAR